jgi:hypothetical protein
MRQAERRSAEFANRRDLIKSREVGHHHEQRPEANRKEIWIIRKRDFHEEQSSRSRANKFPCQHLSSAASQMTADLLPLLS